MKRLLTQTGSLVAILAVLAWAASEAQARGPHHKPCPKKHHDGSFHGSYGSYYGGYHGPSYGYGGPKVFKPHPGHPTVIKPHPGHPWVPVPDVHRHRSHYRPPVRPHHRNPHWRHHRSPYRHRSHYYRHHGRVDGVEIAEGVLDIISGITGR